MAGDRRWRRRLRAAAADLRRWATGRNQLFLHDPCSSLPILHDPILHDPILRNPILHDPYLHDPYLHDPYLRQRYLHDRYLTDRYLRRCRPSGQPGDHRDAVVHSRGSWGGGAAAA